MAPSYVFATEKSWHLAAFAAYRAQLPGAWTIVTSLADLKAAIERETPRYAFFPHWSYLVPPEVLAKVECVCFHMTDLPYGRGGSPLQNLIALGRRRTKLSALRMVDALDAGPVYAKRELSLEGTALEIFERAALTTLELTRWIAREEPEPAPQTGEPTVFARRRPEQSLLPSEPGAERLYDHIRMLDAPGYPPAFVEHGAWRITFDDAMLDGETVTARARIAPKEPRE